MNYQSNKFGPAIGATEVKRSRKRKPGKPPAHRIEDLQRDVWMRKVWSPNAEHIINYFGYWSA